MTGAGIGPVEPGEGTRDSQAPRTGPRTPGARRTARIRGFYARHRRAVLCAAAAAVLAAGAARVYST
ncbi:Tat pathway signal sequence domain protein, partial [Streptomyces sp. NPDC031705]